LFCNISNKKRETIQGIAMSQPGQLWLATSEGLAAINLGAHPTRVFNNTAYAIQYGARSVHKLKGRDSLLYSYGKGIIHFDLTSNRFKPLHFQEARLPRKTCCLMHFWRMKKKTFG